MDKFKKTFLVDINFSDGETPEVNKLNAFVNATKNALSTLERFLGDGWDDSYPYFTTNDTLAQATKSSLNTELGSKKKLEITSLSRLIGPSSALNPKHLVDGTARTVTEDISANKNNFRLTYTPLDLASLSFTDGTVFASRKTTPGSVLIDGDYYVNSFTGEVMTISPTTSSSVTYDTTLSYFGYSAYPGSSFNIIPSPEQSTKCTCGGPVDGKYTITLPTIEKQEANDLNTSVTLDDSQLNYGVQLELPEVLNIMTTGDVVPDGFLYIRDDNTNQVYRSATYYYYSQTQLQVGGVTLDTSHGFTIITVGTTITQSIQDLQAKLFRLRRGLDTVGSIDIGNINGRTGPSANTSETRAEPYVQSEAPNNHFSQYLHRDGWFENYDDGNINDQNGMRGDLVILNTVRLSNSRNHTTGDLSDSYKLWFAARDTGYAPSIYYKALTRALALESPVRIELNAPTLFYGLDTEQDVTCYYSGELSQSFVDGDNTFSVPDLAGREILFLSAAVSSGSVFFWSGFAGSGVTSSFQVKCDQSTGDVTIFSSGADKIPDGSYTIKIFAMYI